MKRALAGALLLSAATTCAAATEFNLSRSTAWFANGDIMDTANGTAPHVQSATMVVDGWHLTQRFKLLSNGSPITVTMGATVTSFDGVTAQLRNDNGLSSKLVILHNPDPLTTMTSINGATEVDQWVAAGDRAAPEPQAGKEISNPPDVVMGDFAALIEFVAKQ